MWLGILLVILVAASVVVVVKHPLRDESARSGFGFNKLSMVTQESAPGNAGGISAVSADMAAPMAKSIIAPRDNAPVSPSEVPDRLIIKTGSLAMVVSDVSEAIKKIGQYAQDKGGYIVTSNITKDTVSPSGNITLRLPVKEFDNGYSEIKSMGEVKSENTSGQDVTEEYVDLDAQLRNLRASESQFLEIMKRASRIEDVLAVQRELTLVRGQIERTEGRMKYLKESASFSTLTVYLSTNPSNLPVVDDSGETWKPLAVFKDAVRDLLDIGKSLVNGVIWLVVFVPVWALLGLIGWFGYKKIKNKK